MGYRSQEEMLKHRISELEHELGEVTRERDHLHGRLQRTERALRVYRDARKPIPWRELRAWLIVLWSGAAGLFVVGILLAMSDLDEPAEALIRGSIAISVLGPLFPWTRAGRPVVGLMVAVGKAAGVVVAGVHWGAFLPHASQPWEVFRFFWYVPTAMLVAVALESTLLKLANHGPELDDAEE